MTKWLIVLASLTGCMAMPTLSYKDMKEMVHDIKPVKLECDTDAFYAHGVNSGTNRKNMSSKLADHCPPETKADLNAAYKEGYKYGLEHSTSSNVNTESKLQ